MATEVMSLSFDAVACCECGVIFGMPSQLNQNRHEDKCNWHCPNGHIQHYTGKTAGERLKEAELTLSLTREEAGRKDKQIIALKRRLKRKK